MQSPPFPAISPLLGPNILLNTMFSNTISFLSFCIISDQVSHPYKTIGKIVVLLILISKFLDSNLENRRFCTEWKQAFPHLNLLLISSGIEFCFVKVVPKYTNSSTLSNNLYLNYNLNFSNVRTTTIQVTQIKSPQITIISPSLNCDAFRIITISPQIISNQHSQVPTQSKFLSVHVLQFHADGQMDTRTRRR